MPVTSEKIRIIHMDDDMVVVNKPASIPVSCFSIGEEGHRLAPEIDLGCFLQYSHLGPSKIDRIKLCDKHNLDDIVFVDLMHCNSIQEVGSSLP